MDHAQLLADRLDRDFHFTVDGVAGLWLDLARALACGRAVDTATLASDECDATEAATIVAGFPCLETTDDGRVAGSIVSVIPTDHRITHSGGTAFTWCMFDALLMGLILPGRVHVETTCQLTGEPLRLSLSGGEIESADPSHLVTLPVDFPPGGDLRHDFCCRARLWTSDPQHEGVVAYPVDRALAITRRTAELLRLVADPRTCVDRG